ncbi:MAG: hypothetical protein HZA81_03260 [Candidatus Taylorbacteria bacterium]|nr:hypothetical protein [Candidatus Taylorbacteria bacterium]
MSLIYRKHRGYTLVETIVYAALVAALLLVIVGSTIALAKGHKRSQAYLDVNSAAVSAFSRFSRDIRRASSVDTVNSVLGASSGKLVLNMRRPDGSNDVSTFYLSDTKVKIDKNGVFEGDITQDNMAVSNLTFRKFTAASSTAIRVEMTLAPDASSTVPALNFYGTYVLRGSYTE